MPITIKGVPELYRKLDRAAAIETLRPPMQRAVLGLQAGMAKYPPAVPGSAYRRTGTLGRTWTSRVTPTGDGLEGRVGNVTVYAPAVQSALEQAAVHRGRWQTDESEIERQQSMIEADFQDAIDRALGGI